MKLLLDTHFVYAVTASMEGLSRAEKRFLEERRERLVVSAVSIWEMRLKWNARRRSGARKGPRDPEHALEILSDLELDFLPLMPVHGATPLETALEHADPFDELLVVQAQVEGMKLVSRDAQLEFHPLVHAL